MLSACAEEMLAAIIVVIIIIIKAWYIAILNK